MRALLLNPLWQRALVNRKYQRLLGTISGIFLFMALLALFDGLLAQMRQGTNALELLPGQAITISGPVALKNPVTSDLVARFTPADAPLSFDLEGFFTGYWFGNGMWRGKIVADEAADPGLYALSISFRGASLAAAQKYELRVFSDAEAKRAAALSWMRRYFAINPFILAACSGGFGIFLGLFTYWFGRRYGNALGQLGLAEIYATDPATGSIWCLAPAALSPGPGRARLILDSDGRVFGEARTVGWKKGKLQLVVMDEKEPPKGALVCLRHPSEKTSAN